MAFNMMTAEMIMLNAVLVAETIDHADWEGVKAMADSAPLRSGRRRPARGLRPRRPRRGRAPGLGTTMRLRMTKMHASSEAIATMGAKTEEMIATVNDRFSDDEA